MRSIPFAIGMSLSIIPAIAQAADEQVCSAAHVQAQVLKRDAPEKLIERRAQLRICAGSTCARSIIEACTKWMSEVDDLIPTMVVAVTDEHGLDVKSVNLVVDGTARASGVYRADGSRVELDPGEHKLFVAAIGYRTEYATVTVRPGERTRLALVLTALAPLAPKREREAESGGRPIPTASLIAFGGGAVGLLAGVVLTVVALGEKSKCSANACVGTNPTANESALEKETIGLTLGYATAVVGAGLGLALWLHDTKKDPAPTNLGPPSARARVMPLLGAGWLGVAASF